MNYGPSFLSACFVVASVLIPGSASGADKLVVAGYGGSFEKMMQDAIIPGFEAKFGTKVEYVAGQSSATLARLQAQKGNQEIDVIIVDDGPIYQAIEYGYCAPVEKTAVFDNLYDVGKIDDRAVALTLGYTGILYNEDIFRENGWDAPQSWADLANDAFKDQISLLGAASTTGLHGLVMVAKANGGSEADIEPGFKAYSEKIRPNILTFAPSAPKLEELLQGREIAITVIADGRATGLQKSGLPVKFVMPKEGSPALMTATCPIVGSDAPEQSQSFIKYLLSEPVQKIFADAGYPPVNKNTELTEEQKKTLPSDDAAISKMVTLDWRTINKNRAAWTQRWNREVER